MVQHNLRSVCLSVCECVCVCLCASVRPIREGFLQFDRECKIFGSPIQITRVISFCMWLAMFNPKYFLLAFFLSYISICEVRMFQSILSILPNVVYVVDSLLVSFIEYNMHACLFVCLSVCVIPCGSVVPGRVDPNFVYVISFTHVNSTFYMSIKISEKRGNRISCSRTAQVDKVTFVFCFYFFIVLIAGKPTRSKQSVFGGNE